MQSIANGSGIFNGHMSEVVKFIFTRTSYVLVPVRHCVHKGADMHNRKLTENDMETYRKVLAYFLSCDAHVWCRENGIECDEALAENMASSILCSDGLRGRAYWNAFAPAYEKCRDFLL